MIEILLHIFINFKILLWDAEHQIRFQFMENPCHWVGRWGLNILDMAKWSTILESTQMFPFRRVHTNKELKSAKLMEAPHCLLPASNQLKLNK